MGEGEEDTTLSHRRWGWAGRVRKTPGSATGGGDGPLAPLLSDGFCSVEMEEKFLQSPQGSKM